MYDSCSVWLVPCGVQGMNQNCWLGWLISILILKLAWKYDSVTSRDSRDSILDDSRNRQKILSQTQLYSITSFYQISKALIQRSKNPPPPFFPNHAKFFSLIPKNKIWTGQSPDRFSSGIIKLYFLHFAFFAERDIQARDLSTRAVRSWWSDD